eukprot:TRINITY_DN22896_c0_g1_i1.p1 TRINITY_DN22896_c0_g1~~TRINITY_DN22896_c0_g1_i1.p1  ORF type:complete len:394 (-),score=43.08 TRINITY_DN22896_c0_g1_i1:59-1240(-)
MSQYCDLIVIIVFIILRIISRLVNLLLIYVYFFLMIRRPPRSTLSSSSAASDVYKRQSEERAQVLSSSKPTLLKGAPPAPSTSAPSASLSSKSQPHVPSLTTPTHVAPTARQPMTSPAGAHQPSTLARSIPSGAEPNYPQSLISPPPLLESKATQIPEGGGLSLGLLQDAGVINVPHTTHIDMEFTDYPSPSEHHILPHNEPVTPAARVVEGLVRTGSERPGPASPSSPGGVPQVSGHQVEMGGDQVSTKGLTDRSTPNLGAQSTTPTADGTHDPVSEELHPSRTVPTSTTMPKGPQKRVDSSGRQVQTPDVLFRTQKRPHDPSSVGELVVCSSGAQPSSQRALPHPSRHVPLSLIHISEPTRLLSISYAVFCLKKKKKIKHNYTLNIKESYR